MNFSSPSLSGECVVVWLTRQVFDRAGEGGGWRDEEREGELGRTIWRGACEGGGKFLLPLSVWPRRLVSAYERGTD